MKSFTRVLMFLAIVSIPTLGFAQRDVVMKVTYQNPNPYSLVVKMDAVRSFKNGGDLQCDKDPRDILEIGANRAVKITCTAQSDRDERKRNVGLSFQAAFDRLGRPRMGALLQVYEGSHDFRCTRGCTLNQYWTNCRQAGKCEVEVYVKIEKWEQKPD